MRIGELARRTGVGVSTLRAWETRFQFPTPERSATGHRLYSEDDVERVEAVLRLVAEGLTLAAAITRVASVGPGALPDGEAEAILLRQILDAAGQGIWVIKDGRTRYANRYMAELMGCTVDEIVELPIQSLFDPSDRPVVRERTDRVRTGQTLHFQQWLHRPDGSTFLAEVHTTPLLNQAGRYEGGVALVTDVTTKHEQDTAARLRAALLDAIGDAVTASTNDGSVAYINDAAERLFGWRAEDAVGRHERDVFPSPDDPKLGARIRSSLDNGKRYSGRYRMFRRDGTEFVAHLTAAPVFDAAGKPVGSVGVISDQTERDALEHRLTRREQQAEALAVLGAQVLRTPIGERERLVTEALEVTRRMLGGAPDAIVVEVAPGGDELHLAAAVPEVDRPITFRSGSASLPGYVAVSGRAVLVDDAAKDPRFESGSPGELPFASAIAAPMFGPAGVVGALLVTSPEPGTFQRRDAHFVQAMTNLVGLAAASGV